MVVVVYNNLSSMLLGYGVFFRGFYYDNVIYDGGGVFISGRDFVVDSCSGFFLESGGMNDSLCFLINCSFLVFLVLVLGYEEMLLCEEKRIVVLLGCGLFVLLDSCVLELVGE